MADVMDFPISKHKDLAEFEHHILLLLKEFGEGTAVQSEKVIEMAMRVQKWMDAVDGQVKHLSARVRKLDGVEE